MVSTRDGGQQWQDVSGQRFQEFRFNNNRGYSTDGTKFLRTDDGGRNWIEGEIPHIAFIRPMHFLTSEIGWIAGIDDKEFFVFRTTNGGRDWQESRTSTPALLTAVQDLYFIDANRGWLLTWPNYDGGSYLYFTVDGGVHWIRDPDVSFQGKGRFATVARFTSAKNGFLFEHVANRNRLIYTTDGGAHWHQQSMPQFISDCQVFNGELLCSGGIRSKMGVLTLHPK